MHHHLETDVEIDASPAVVWEILTDLSGYSEWNPFIVQAAGDAVVGEKLTNRLQPPGGRAMTFRPTVTVVDEHETFEWIGRLGVRGIFDGRHRFELRATPAGGTVVTHTEDFDGALVRLMRSSLDTGTVAGFEAMNAALKERAEARVSS